MKKFVLCCVVLCLCFGWISFSSHSVLAVVLSDPILIPEPDKPIRVKLPNSEQFIDVPFAIPFSSGTEIDPQNQSSFRVLCPNLKTVRNIPSGSTFEECPDEIERPSDPNFVLLANTFDPWWPPRTPNPIKPLKLIKSTTDQLQLHIAEEDPVFHLLTGDLYFETQIYQKAGIYYDNAFGLFQNNDMQALAQYKLSRSLWLRGRKTDAIEQAWKSLKLYKQGDSTWEFQKEEKYYRSEVAKSSYDIEKEALARHQLALVLWGLENIDEAIQEAERALGLYQQIEQPEMEAKMNEMMIQLIQELLETLESERSQSHQ